LRLLLPSHILYYFFLSLGWLWRMKYHAPLMHPAGILRFLFLSFQHMCLCCYQLLKQLSMRLEPCHRHDHCSSSFIDTTCTSGFQVA
jgi:hypothetical protein